ncbi:hypothetical protein [Turicibacter sanguinis]|uniref:hypothetical protein n=1 Tax=Turicibacter sanguinis TaxID=154288 RepID=UPI0021D51628|nr:hypothetical protein [Turicibacter sanguinis]MCU7198005.1 hypothetical protein [Turicibacter sanguinis]
MHFKTDDEVRNYFKDIDIHELVEEFNVGDETYELEIVVTGYSHVYTHLNESSEWVVMNSGKIVKIG